MNQDKLNSLLQQYFNNTISDTDCAELLQYLNAAEQGDYDELIDRYLVDLNGLPDFNDLRAQKILTQIKADARFINTPVEKRQVPIYQRQWFRVAALLLVCCSVGVYLLKNNFNKSANQNQLAHVQASKPILPGGNKATLKLANGTVIALDDAKNGLIAQAGKVSVNKTGRGQITYQSQEPANTTAYNTFSTPKGGDYQITLPDGTTVRLNSASTLIFPVAFSGKTREVKLTGEAYFEVAHNKDKPFYVTINDTKVRVLGTHFNIKAYADDDHISTTLLEGSVKVTKHGRESLIVPGQQAVVADNSDEISVMEANMAEVNAWRNGYFKFNDEQITNIMKEVSRWYDVEVEYRGNFAGQHFGGTFYRSKSITELLNYLGKLGNVRFKIEGRRIIVMA
jgi:transmembrane sensor